MATFFGGGANADDIIAEIVDSAPATLNTLNELAAALNDDANFASTVTAAIAAKQNAVSGVSSTELGYLGGTNPVTSNIQSQIDGKQGIVSGVSSTEIGYLDGVTSAIQTQLDGKAAKLQTIVQISENFTLPAGSNGKLFYSPMGDNLTVTINANSLEVGEKVDIFQEGNGKITIAAQGFEVDLVSDGNKRSTNGPGTALSLICFRNPGPKRIAIVGNLS